MNLGRWALAILFCGSFILGGCGRGVPSEISASERQTFDSASPELKKAWLNGLEASRTNDYATAQNIFYSLLNQDLSPEQKQAVSKQSTIVMNQLYAGVEKGDPAALKAMEEMRRNPPNRSTLVQ